VVFDEDNFPLVTSLNPTDLVSTVGTRLTTAGIVAPCQPARRSLRDLSHLWLSFSLRQSLRDFCPKRHRLLRHARPRPLLLHQLWSRMARHPVSGQPRQSPTSIVRGSPPPWVPLHHPLFGHLLQEVRAWWCLSRLRRILTGWSHGRRMASECYLIDTSSPPRLCLQHHPRSCPPSVLSSPIPIGVRL
jgi:hypothetical protein